MKIIIAEARNKVNLAIPPQKPSSEKTPLTNHLPLGLPDASILLNSPSFHPIRVEFTITHLLLQLQWLKMYHAKEILKHPSLLILMEKFLVLRLSVCINSTETVARELVKSLDPNDLVGGT